MRIYFFYSIVVSLPFVACNQFPHNAPFCNGDSAYFDKSQWKRCVSVDDRVILQNDTSLTRYYSCLTLREAMICDIVTNRIQKNDSISVVIELLGYGCGGDCFKNCNVRSSKNVIGGIYAGTKTLAYTAGYNGSGDCFFVISFKDNLVEDFYWAEAR